MKNLCILLYDATLIGGAEKISIDLANKLSVDYNITLVSVFSKFEETAFSINSNCDYKILQKGVKSIPKNIFDLQRKLRRIIKKNKIDIVISVTPGVVGIATFACLFSNVKHIFWEHSNLENQTYGKLHYLRQRLGAIFSDKIVVLTNRDKENYKNIFDVPIGKISVIHNYFENPRVDFSYNNNDNIVTVGRLKSVKGYDRLLEVAKRLDNELDITWKWDIYGTGEDENDIRENIKKNNLEERVFLKGITKKPIETMNKYSLYVLTSYYEGLPLALLEAQIARLPIISFDCPTGPAEIVEHEVNGFLIENGNIDEMVDTIKSLLLDSELKRNFSNNSQKNILNFSEKKVINEWRILIDSM